MKELELVDQEWKLVVVSPSPDVLARAQELLEKFPEGEISPTPAGTIEFAVGVCGEVFDVEIGEENYSAIFAGKTYFGSSLSDCLGIVG